jgi:two-component system response regulator MtrA
MPKTIVIVDRDQQIVDEATALLQNIGYHVLSTTGGERAVGLIREVKPQLVIADAEISVWEGRPFYELVQGDPELRNIPIIYLAPRKTIVSLKEKVKVPTLYLMPKPWDVADFIERVQGIVGDAYAEGD